jgi:hypothetical protein
MSLTAHNQFFGWVHSFTINRNNAIFKPNASVERPFPIIVDNPNVGQVLSNWNTADTGMVVSSFVFGLFASKFITDNQFGWDSILKKRFFYKRVVNLFLIGGIYFALTNSINRLEGYVPNGLPKKRTQEVLKYDYTSQFLSQTPWKYIYSGRIRPSNNE